MDEVPSKRILVTKAESQNALAVVRSLSRSGHTVFAGGSIDRCQTFVSRHCTEWFVYRPPASDPAGFIKDVRKFVSENDVDVVLPIGDATTVPLSKHLDQLSDVGSIPVSPYDTLRVAHDKERTATLAEQVDVPTPRTARPTDEEDLRRIADSFDYPLVVKPIKGTTSRGVTYHESASGLMERYSFDGAHDAAFDERRPLVQEYVKGDVHDVCVLFDRGKLQAALTQKRAHMHPVSGGGGVINRTTDNPELIGYADELLSELDWHGVAQIEFKVDQNKEANLIEINPKIWGTMELSIMAGMDFPQKLVALASGHELKEQFEYDAHLGFVWIERGLLGIFLESSDRLSVVQDILELCRGNCAQNLSVRDPLPHVMRVPQIASSFL